jgi:chromosome segregation ATPase
MFEGKCECRDEVGRLKIELETIKSKILEVVPDLVHFRAMTKDVNFAEVARQLQALREDRADLESERRQVDAEQALFGERLGKRMGNIESTQGRIFSEMHQWNVVFRRLAYPGPLHPDDPFKNVPAR